MTDEAIIELYFLRNEDAIRESDTKYGAYCHAIAENILKSGADAEECVNDTWMRAWLAIPPQRPRVLKLFFARITRNLSFNRHRELTADKRGRGELDVVLDELEYCIGTSDVDEHIEAEALGESINRFLAALDVRERSVFLRRYFYAEPIGVIAARYGLRSGNVSTILSRTRKKLRAHLQREGYIV
ncbi:MAG: sigma-70 family RNA polymerase sigma factor [Clostridia bacterium]|nr:sigma-70 family RNA polymerase sigma factor [Clostridia bacterium]